MVVAAHGVSGDCLPVSTHDGNVAGFLSNSRARNYLILWAGQFLSVIGSGMTSFVLAIWVYKTSLSTGQFAGMALAASLPAIVMAPFAGVIVDRWDKRAILAISTIGQALATGSMSLAFNLGWVVTYWQIYPVTALIAFCGAFQGPALALLGTAMVPKEFYSRAASLWQLNQAALMIVSPILAAALMPFVHLGGIILFDAASYGFALLSVYLIGPWPAANVKTGQGAKSGAAAFFAEMAAGWDFIQSREPLLLLLLVSMNLGIVSGIVQILVLPLSVRHGSAWNLASIMAFSAAGLILGSLVMMLWKGPVRQIRGVVISATASSVALCLAGMQRNALGLSICFFLTQLVAPLGRSTMGAIWLRKTPAGVLGRVTATSTMLALLCFPLGCCIAPLLSDHVFPALVGSGGPLARVAVVRTLWGNSYGAVGMAMSFLGIASLALLLVACAFPSFRLIEERLPDVRHAGDAEIAPQAPVESVGATAFGVVGAGMQDGGV